LPQHQHQPENQQLENRGMFVQRPIQTHYK